MGLKAAEVSGLVGEPVYLLQVSWKGPVLRELR